MTTRLYQLKPFSLLAFQDDQNNFKNYLQNTVDSFFRHGVMLPHLNKRILIQVSTLSAVHETLKISAVISLNKQLTKSVYS